MTAETILGGFTGMVAGWIIWYLFLDKPFEKLLKRIFKF